MCKSFLCDVYQQELKGAHKQVSRLQREKRYGHWLDTIDFEIKVAQRRVDAAQAKIDDLHAQQIQEASK